MEGSAGMTHEEATNQRRWFNTGMKGVDWTEGYQGEGNGDESEGRGSEYKGTGFEYDECHRKREGANSEESRPSEETLKSLSKFDENNLGRFGLEDLAKLGCKFSTSCSRQQSSIYWSAR